MPLSKTISHISSFVEQSVTAICVRGLVSNGWYSNVLLEMMIKSLVDNSVKSWLPITEFSTTPRKLVQEVGTSSPCVMKAIEAIVDS